MTINRPVSWRVFPVGPVPANLLRWHFVFACPVDAVATDAAVELLDATGQPVLNAFVDWPGGLWDETGTRLTLLMHPGRLKTGLSVRRDVGPALVEGHAMSLRLRPTGLGDAEAAAGEHRFTVQAAESRALDTAAWWVDAPVAGECAPLRVHFDRTMDAITLPGSFAVVDEAGRRVAGDLRASCDGRSASFRPFQPWQAGAHAWLVDPELEDLCGNRVGLPFEGHRTDAARRPWGPRQTPVLPFRVDCAP